MRRKSLKMRQMRYLGHGEAVARRTNFLSFSNPTGVRGGSARDRPCPQNAPKMPSNSPVSARCLANFSGTMGTDRTSEDDREVDLAWTGGEILSARQEGGRGGPHALQNPNHAPAGRSPHYPIYSKRRAPPSQSLLLQYFIPSLFRVFMLWSSVAERLNG